MQIIYILNKIAGKQTTSYNMPGAFEIKGDIDIKAYRMLFKL